MADERSWRQRMLDKHRAELDEWWAGMEEMTDDEVDYHISSCSCECYYCTAQLYCCKGYVKC